MNKLVFAAPVFLLLFSVSVQAQAPDFQIVSLELDPGSVILTAPSTQNVEVSVNVRNLNSDLRQANIEVEVFDPAGTRKHFEDKPVMVGPTIVEFSFEFGPVDQTWEDGIYVVYARVKYGEVLHDYKTKSLVVGINKTPVPETSPVLAILVAAGALAVIALKARKK